MSDNQPDPYGPRWVGIGRGPPEETSDQVRQRIHDYFKNAGIMEAYYAIYPDLAPSGHFDPPKERAAAKSTEPMPKTESERDRGGGRGGR